MDKREFYERLLRAGQIAKDLAATLVLDPLPEKLVFTIRPYDDPRGRRGPPGTIKFLGGRLLTPIDLRRLTAANAAALLWVDGRVPVWINVNVSAALESATELEIVFSHTLVPADENELPPDIRCARGNPLVPFRIRGPAMPAHWRSVELDGRFPLTSEYDGD